MSIESKLLKLMEGVEGYLPLGVGTSVEINDPAHPAHGTVAKIKTARKDGDQVPVYTLEGVDGEISHNQIKLVEPEGKAPVSEEKEESEDETDEDEGKENADQVEDQPSVTIDNPINPDLNPSADSQEMIDAADSQEDDQDQDGDENKGKENVKEETMETMGSILQETELSEEFKLKAATLFEAKVTEKATILAEEKIAQLEEEYQTKLSESVSQIEKELIENIDGYFGALSEQWMKDNELALEASIKSDLTESFINGMKQLFESHWIDLPVEKFDIVNSLEDKNKKLSEELENKTKLLEESTAQLKNANREIIMENATKGMTDIDASKFRVLMEDFDFEDSETFVKRTEIIKESFFGSGKKEIKDQPLKISGKPLIEEVEIKQTPANASPITQFADFIRKTSKN